MCLDALGRQFGGGFEVRCGGARGVGTFAMWLAWWWYANCSYPIGRSGGGAVAQ